ncbi:hypothetical protein FQA39_LY18321 [Lamprigera yunnana]|nr:hypothetical protein FQA39_LY18321 [Lamprigera yunnana]
MTILPTKRSVNNSGNDENTDNGNSSTSKERSARHRDELNAGTDSPSSSGRRQFPYSGSERKELQKLYKENSLSVVRDQRDRERKKQRELRRERKRDRQNKRTTKSDTSDSSDSTSTSDCVIPEESDKIVEKKDLLYIDEDGSGCNSEDEYEPRRHLRIGSTAEEWTRRDTYFERCLSKLGFEIKKMHEDGACLFRAIADQVYGDQELHSTVRTQCMDYIVKNQDFFAPYVTEDFHKYVERKRRWTVHGNHLEIQAISEMYNRTIEVYCYRTEPTNIFNAPSMNTYEPIRISYHRMCHYNSIINPNKPELAGLSVPNYCTRYDFDRRDIHDAVRKSEDMLIEQTMLEDKLKATDWEATNEAIEEQVARESYIQFYRDVERRLKTESSHPSSTCIAGSSSTITSGVCLSPRSLPHKGSVSPRGSPSPKELSLPKVGSMSPKGSHSGPLRVSTSTADVTSPLSELENTDYNLGISPTTKSYMTHNEVSADSLSLATDTNHNIFQGDTIYQSEEDYQDWDETVMAQVLAESQLTYFEDLKRMFRKRNDSPGPSTSK